MENLGSRHELQKQASPTEEMEETISGIEVIIETNRNISQRKC